MYPPALPSKAEVAIFQRKHGTHTIRTPGHHLRENSGSYVMTITQKSPKLFRCSLIGRMQGYVLDIVEELYYANDIYVTPASRSGLGAAPGAPTESNEP